VIYLPNKYMMEEYSLYIQENGKINSTFVRANLALIQEHKNNLLSLGSDLEKSTYLESLWKSEYKGIVEKSDSASLLTTEKWHSIRFLNKMHYTVFMLRWG
jgi:hypothetical protein